MFDLRPYTEPLSGVPLDQFPQSPLLPKGCQILEGLADDDLYQVEFREMTYVTRTLEDGSACPRSLYVLIPSSKDPIKASYGKDGYPCVVFCQGSGWRTQHIYGHFADHVRLAERGFVVASVQYRESSLAPFPAQMQDFKTAVRFLRAHADELHIDPARMAAWGDSSGAHTVLMASFTAEGPATISVEGETIALDTPIYADQMASVSCVVDWYGPTALDQMNCIPSAQDHNRPESPEGAVLGQRVVREHPEWSAAASPLSYVVPASERTMPPTLIMHGGRDQIVNFEQSVLLYEALRSAGQEVEFYKLPDAHHGSGGFRCAAALDMVEAFLRKHLVP
ncbi:MAG: alpha/beta hydrolase [Atopobiaceae bacterium]|nr:alpha/beta hydrolase [Atopobiaceae bacterium]